MENITAPEIQLFDIDHHTDSNGIHTLTFSSKQAGLLSLTIIGSGIWRKPNLKIETSGAGEIDDEVLMAVVQYAAYATRKAKDDNVFFRFAADFPMTNYQGRAYVYAKHNVLKPYEGTNTGNYQQYPRVHRKPDQYGES